MKIFDEDTCKTWMIYLI
ncbi:hypothetical protein D1953_16645 [Peribacillus asahii]|uniref:Uncharacterized protein n=1 Tax=Peribacillus asahii TaxID=228899 RepID=A0A398AZP0_9BACI|nr:hypothetical protein D1953_16645 [Peribacillus asahii]